VYTIVLIVCQEKVQSESDFMLALITYKFHSLVISLSNIGQERVFMSCIPDIGRLKG